MPHSNKKGFTLVELMMVVLILVLLATAAISTYTNSTSKFSYLGAYKEMMSTFRNARSYTINNKDFNGTVPERYGVCLGSDSIVLFVDSGDKNYEYDLEQGEGVGNCSLSSANSQDINSNPNYDEIINAYDFSNYTIKANDSEKGELTLPIFVYYEKTGSVTVIKNNNGGPIGIEEKYLTISFLGENGNLAKYAVLFLFSGLAEEYDDLNIL